MKTQSGMKMVYEQARAALSKAGLKADEIADAALTQTFIRLEILLTNNSTMYKLPVLVNDTTTGPVRPTEQRLNLQDAVYTSEINIYIAKATSATDVAFVPKTYPSPVTFTTGAPFLPALYNGKLSISVNNVIIYPALDLLQFLKIPRTQLTAATNSPLDEFYGSEQLIMQPNLVLIGQKNTQITVQLPGPIATIDPFTYLIIELRGLLAQNVTLIS